MSHIIIEVFSPLPVGVDHLVPLLINLWPSDMPKRRKINKILLHLRYGIIAISLINLNSCAYLVVALANRAAGHIDGNRYRNVCIPLAMAI